MHWPEFTVAIRILSGAATILLQASSTHTLAEAERAVTDAVRAVEVVLQAPQMVAGGGAAEVACCCLLREEALRSDSEQQAIFEAFGEALLALPHTVIYNSRGKAGDQIAQLIKIHSAKVEGTTGVGFDCTHGTIRDVQESGTWEPLESKQHAYRCAVDTACMILSVDQTI